MNGPVQQQYDEVLDDAPAADHQERLGAADNQREEEEEENLCLLRQSPIPKPASPLERRERKAEAELSSYENVNREGQRNKLDVAI